MKIKHTIVASGIAAMLLPCVPLLADEMQDIRNEIKSMKESYESRTKALEDRLKEAEGKASQAQESAQKAEASATKAETTAKEAASAPVARPPATANGFNPAMSLILSGAYANLSKDPTTWRLGGFQTGDGIGPGDRGFNLGESELTFSASVDHLFYGNLTYSVDRKGQGSVEEAFFRTTGLSNGFTVKGGRFFSGIGYLNEVHAHAWDFVDQPLAYQAFLGGQLAQEGIQAKWLAPTPLFLEFGLEAGRGAEFPGVFRNKNGVAAGAGFVHLGGDVGVSNSWRGGLSYLHHAPKDRGFVDTDSGGIGVTDSFNGKSNLWMADFIWKWSPNGNPINTNFKFQAEYFHRKENGDLTFDTAAASPFGTQVGDFSSAQSGFYLQGVYQFLPQWRVGLRYDQLSSGTTNIGLVDSGTLTADDFSIFKKYNPKRATLMFDWNPSEFTRIRLQYAHDKSRPDASDNQLFLQYIYSLGTHGAHKF